MWNYHPKKYLKLLNDEISSCCHWLEVLQVLLPCKSSATATPNLTWQRMTRGKSTGGKWRSLWWDACAICSYICLMWVTNWQRSKPWQVDNHFNKSKLETVESLSSLVCYYNQPFHAISSTVCLGPPVFPIEHLKHHSQGHQRRSGVYGKLR